ncbi:TM2 domain-containing protein [Actinomyces qiguomingii]|uniref:TM2 domain-containing protein n=1 Tax=Actinomyces qiguomingii TaxID=2057800 RepID=UPI000CA02617|nr:TM2 domain-containing protein [Actinomyces qiguomingii]
MAQNPVTPDPADSQSAGYNQPAGGGYDQPAGAGYGQPVGQPPAYGGQQQAYSNSQPGYGAPAYGNPYGQGGYVEPKSKVAAALLAFFLGEFGVHNFYRGQTRNGIIHLCLVGATIVLFIIGFASIAGTIDTSTGDVSDAGAAGFGVAMLLAWLALIVNGIWKLVEFIMILVSNDGSLR